MQLHLPDAQKNFAVIGKKEELIESQMEEMSCILMYEWCEYWCEWRLSCYKRIIREKDAKASGDLVVTKE